MSSPPPPLPTDALSSTEAVSSSLALPANLVVCRNDLVVRVEVSGADLQLQI